MSVETWLHACTEAFRNRKMAQGMLEVVGSGGANIGLEHDVSSSGGELTTVPVPNIFQSIPTICEAILENNLKGQLLFHL